MSQGPASNPISREKFDAVLFDLDGVLTATAKLHAACWKKMFDEYLKKRAAEKGEAFRPFEIAKDYRLYVDGKPRLDGVRDFLRSREIQLPQGTPDDSPRHETVCGLGNRKNELVNDTIQSKGAEAYEGSVPLLRQLRKQGIKTAVVTSSQNCDKFLRAAEIADLFDTQVDGTVAAQQHLAGKPAPDSFLLAATNLSVEPHRVVVVEDAISGVQAGRAGGFGLVIGIARKGNAAELKKHGADIVVSDLTELLG